MATSSPSTLLTSFDPAIHLHSESQVPPTTATAAVFEEDPPPASDTFSDDLEALHSYHSEQARNKVVIRHRAWNLSDVFRSDEDLRPYTPTKSSKIHNNNNNDDDDRLSSPPLQKKLYSPVLQSSPPIAVMPFMSSPAVPALGSQSPADQQKRKNDDAGQPSEPKRQKIVGGFVEEDDDDDNEEVAAFGDDHLDSQFESSQEQPVGPSRDLESSQHPLLSNFLANSTSGPDMSTNSFGSSGRTLSNVNIKTCTGKVHSIPMRTPKTPIPYEQLVASRSTTAPARAKKSYYGIEVHKLLDEAARDAEQSARARHAETGPTAQPSIEIPVTDRKTRKLTSTMWTEKYRARKFTELVGDERTHRSVMRWLKGWDAVVFPNLAKSRPKTLIRDDDERSHRKVLLLCGPPGLGKTTMAHVCARQAGYEVLEINASDERSKDVVKGRIRDALGTENVKGVNVEVGHSKIRKPGRPVCVVIDEVDGVVSGSGGGGEGGFMRALIDLILLDQKNASQSSEQHGTTGRKRKGDNFRFLRPLILICNDVYHPSLRPLRASSVAEMVHVRQTPLENVVQRVKHVFGREGIACDNDAARRLCEASWGLTSRKRQGSSKSSGGGEGDIRSVLVAAEWVAHKLRHADSSPQKLSRNWLEQNVLSDSAEGGSFFKSLNRGGLREIVDRVFTEGAGFPDPPAGFESSDGSLHGDDTEAPTGLSDNKKRHAMDRLRQMVDSSGEHDRCISECFGVYPVQEYQDDTLFSKPNAACDWLLFHDAISSKVFHSQEWELSAYLSQSVLAFHHMFATANGKKNVTRVDDEEDDDEEHPFSGPRAEYAAFEAQKQSRAILTGFQSSFSASMLRLFRSAECVVTDLIPNLIRMLSPDVKPVVVRSGGEQRSVASVRKESERALVRLAVRVMTGIGVTFEKVRVEAEGGGYGGWAYRMEPPIDTLVSFSKVKGTSLPCVSGSAPVRYAVRQVLDQEYRKVAKQKQPSILNASSSSSFSSKTGKKSTKQPGLDDSNEQDAISVDAADKYIKRDFFGRVIENPTPQTSSASNANQTGNSNTASSSSKTERNVYITFHEGYSNAVRKPISMSELLAGL